MDVSQLKEYILNNDKVETILIALGCGDIKNHDTYYSASNVGGDNRQAITIYLNDNLTTIDYTRDIPQLNGCSDIFSLIEFFQNCNFFEAMKFACQCVGIDYYYDFEKDVDPAIQYTKMLMEMNNDGQEDDEEKLIKPIPEKILTYYQPWVNEQFYVDGITYIIQKEFEIGFDEDTQHITIPIRDEIGTLVGVKGRYLGEPPKDVSKYTYLEPCCKSQILYNLFRAYDYIQQLQTVFVFESEKSVMQCWSFGYKNCVATGGCKISKHQIMMLEKISANIIFCYDSDVTIQELQEISKRFFSEINIYAIYDRKQKYLNPLKKESPSDKGKDIFDLITNDHDCITLFKER